MRKIIGLMLVVSSFSAYSFDHVSDVLVSGKALVCKGPDQKRSGDKVENFRVDGSSKRESALIKTGDFKLPAVGQKVKIVRSQLVRKNKSDSSFVHAEVGEALVADANLMNESRTQVSYPFRGPTETALVALTPAEVERIKIDCIVLAPVGETKIQTHDLVQF